MYSQDDMNMRKAYQQVNEVFGKNYLGLLGNKMLSKFSTTAEENVRLIRYANRWADQMKRDAAASGLSYSKLSPDWVDAWFDKRFDFYPSDYDETYKSGENLSDFIRRALAIKQQKDMLSKLERRKSTRSAEKEAAKLKPLKDVQQNVVGLDALKTSKAKQSTTIPISPTTTGEREPIALSDEDVINLTVNAEPNEEIPIKASPKKLSALEIARKEQQEAEAQLEKVRKQREALEKANPSK